MRRRYYPLIVLAGAAAAALPTTASSDTPPVVSAQDMSGVYGASHSWSPANVTVAQGGAVTFQYQPGAPPQGSSMHSVVFQSPPSTPSCSGVPQTDGSGQPAPWSGTCTFSAPGTYNFVCGVHGAAMSGAITVTGSGMTTGTTTGPSTGPTADASALAVASSQKGTSVRGKVTIGHDGSSLSAVLTASGRLAKVTRVGSLAKTGLKAGRYRFAVPLNRRGRRALKRRHRISLTLRLRVNAPDRTSATLSTRVRLTQL
jgi:plastocyanin